MKLPREDRHLKPILSSKQLSTFCAVCICAILFSVQSCGTKNDAAVQKVPGTTDSGNGDLTAVEETKANPDGALLSKKETPVNPQSFGRPTLLGKHLLADKGFFFGPRASVKIYTEQAEAGDVDAMTRVAICHYLGRGTTVNYGSARQWFEKAADQNDKKSQFALGYMFEHGEGVDKDLKTALKWYMKGAEGHGQYATLSQENVERLSKELAPEEVNRLRQEVVDWYNMSNQRKRNVEKLRRPY